MKRQGFMEWKTWRQITATSLFLNMLLILTGLVGCTFLDTIVHQLPSYAEYPTEPILRLNPESHFAKIYRIDVDAGAHWMVTGSGDKTVKVWDLDNGKLQRTLRLPIGKGHLGKVYAVAISPDGSQVAAGGWTGPQVGANSIYVFDRVSGSLKYHIQDLPEVIRHLAYSVDGTRMVATLGGKNGIRLYHTGDYSEIGRDPAYGSDAYGADFSPDGRLVTSSNDGWIRLYGSAGQLQKSVKARGGQRPFGVAFDPVGKWIAVGYDDSTQVEVLNARTLERLFIADSEGVSNGSLSSVAWSTDGETLLAGGSYYAGGWTPIRRWHQGGSGSFDELRVVNQTIMAINPLMDGRLVVGAANGVTLLGAEGQRIWEHPNAVADFRGQLGNKGIRLSRTGEVVAFGYELWGKNPAHFNLTDLSLTQNAKKFIDLLQPDQGPRGAINVTDWANSTTPKLNGHPLSLDEFEHSRSLAIAPDGHRFVLGTSWHLRCFNVAGIQLWEHTVPGEVWAVNINGDGRYVVAGYEDGTLRWHRMRDGMELLALYPHPDGQRWVLWTPQGYYQASAGGEDLIGWHMNRDSGEAPDFFPASRFRERFYRPDVIARVLETGDPLQALRLADEAQIAQIIENTIDGLYEGLAGKVPDSVTQSKALFEVLPPTIEILSPVPGTKIESRRLNLFYQARSDNSPITKVEARIDGRPAKVLDHVVSDTVRGSGMWTAQMILEIPPRDASIELIAFNQHGAGEAARFRANWTGAVDYYKPDLWVLAVGISDHPVEKARLNWAAQDAKDLVKALKAQEGGLYKKVHYQLLTNERATRDEIRKGLNWLKRETDARDVAILFLSGHGFRDAYDDYYYLPYDGDLLEVELSSVSGDDFRKFLRDVAGKTVLFLDTCYSGGLRAGKGVTDSLPDITRFANELADAESGVIVFASSTGKQLSHERDKWHNGAFTEALLEGLKGKADYTEDFFLVISELETYLAKRVSELTGGQQKPVTTKPKAVENYRLLQVKHR